MSLDLITNWPVDENGVPLALVTGTASDHVPTVPGGSATIGPVAVTRFVRAGTAEELDAGITETQRHAEKIVAQERRLVQWSKAGGIQPQPNPS